jgi:ABC-type ATPase involved in cell division
MDFGKFFEFFNFTYAQLKTIALISLSTVSLVYVVGKSVGGKTTEFNKMSTSITELTKKVEDLDKSVKENTVKTGEKIDGVYTDFMKIYEANNEIWNTKFTLLIDHGTKNKELLKTLIKLEDKKNELENTKIINNKEYNTGENNDNIDIVDPVISADRVKK